MKHLNEASYPGVLNFTTIVK